MLVTDFWSSAFEKVTLLVQYDPAFKFLNVRERLLFVYHYSLLLFLPVGKTELAKQVARYLHKDNKKVVQVFLKLYFVITLFKSLKVTFSLPGFYKTGHV